MNGPDLDTKDYVGAPSQEDGSIADKDVDPRDLRTARADAKGQGSRAPVGERFLPTIEALPDNLFGHVKFKSQPFWTHMKEKFSYCPETVLRAERIANNKVPLAAAGVKQ